MTPRLDTRAAVAEHFAAFNGHDTERLLRGLDERVTWATGADTYRDRAALLEIFDDWLWQMAPRIDVTRLVVDGELAAAEAVEHMVVEGTAVEFAIAVFFTVREGLISSVKVFREGSSTIPTAI